MRAWSPLARPRARHHRVGRVWLHAQFIFAGPVLVTLGIPAATTSEFPEA
jgi:hypothetical protein